MLAVLRTVFGKAGRLDGVGEGAVGIEEVVLRVGTMGVELDLTGFGVGRPDIVTERTEGVDLLGVVEGICDAIEALELRLLCEGVPSSVDFWRDLATGRAGRGPVGGAAKGGRGLRGMAEVMVATGAVEDI